MMQVMPNPPSRYQLDAVRARQAGFVIRDDRIGDKSLTTFPADFNETAALSYCSF